MEILWWLAPSVVATIVATIYVSWVGHKPPAGRDRSEAAQDRMAAALKRSVPQSQVAPVSQPHSNGVVVHQTRRSA
jgi:hypothetical protein